MLVLCLCCTGFSLVVNSGSSVVAVRGLLTAVAFLLVDRVSREFVLASGVAACGLSSCCSGALDYRLNSCGTWAYVLQGMWDQTCVSCIGREIFNH